jgi:hypothetical protein
LFVRYRWAIVLLVTLAIMVPTAAPLAATPEDPSPEVAARAFERYKALAGVWRADSTKGWSEDITIEVIAKGSVVMSTTTFEDAPDAKMVTLYSLDGPSLVATHYCESRTQPHLVATEINADATTVHFTFAGGGNLASRDRGHMDQALFRFTGDDEFSSQWTWYQDGADDWMEEIHYRRIR